MAILSGQTIVTAAGTVVKFTSLAPAGTYRIKALVGNAAPVFVGFPGTTALTTQNGFELSAGRDFIDVVVDNLNTLYVDAANNDDGVCWIRLQGSIVGLKPPA